MTKIQSLKEAKLRRHRLEAVRVSERIRAAVVAALPKPAPDPIEAHLNPDCDACAICSRELLGDLSYLY